MNLKTALLAASLAGLLPVNSLELSGYYENWSQYRNINTDGSNRGVFPSCTPNGFAPIAKNLSNFNYAFALFNYNKGAATNDWKVYLSEWNDLDLLGQAAALKQQNRNLKIMLSIGGWNFIDANSNYGPITQLFFHQLLADPTKQQKFIDSLIDPASGWFFQIGSDGSYLLDGIDLDYEYPGQLFLGSALPGANPPYPNNNPDAASDYQGYITFIQALRSAFNTLNAAGKRPPVYLSITPPPFMPSYLAVGSSSSGTYPTGTYLSGQSYDAVNIDPNNPSTYFGWYSIVANHCDWVNIMTYDMYGAFSTIVQYQAPLYNGYQPPYSATTIPDNSSCQAYSVDYSLWMWTQGAKQATTAGAGLGISKSIINLGLPAYGRSYGNTSPFPTNPIGTGNTNTKGGAAQKYTQQAGTAAYFEIEGLKTVSAPMFQMQNSLASAGGSPSVAQSYLVLNQTNLNPPNNVFVYDSQNDIKTKTTYATSQGLKGVFFYALSEDNLSGNGSTGYNFSLSLFNSALQVVSTPQPPVNQGQNIGP